MNTIIGEHPNKKMDNKRTVMPNGRYTDKELELLKNVFAENLELVKNLRRFMLQLPMPEAEEINFRNTFKSPDLSALMRKFFLPELDGDAPIGQVIDLWMTVNMENKMAEENASLVESRGLVIAYIEQQVNSLADGSEEVMKFKDLKTLNIEQLRARNTIIMHVENQLREIYGLAGYKQETPEETLKRLSQNSTK